MWPWGHLAIGYLLYTVYCGVVRGQVPRGWPVVVLAIGTQFPDFVDKPLAYWFGVLPGGRTLTHSLVVYVPTGIVLVTLSWYYGRAESGIGFSIGWGAHLVGDALNSLLQGSYGQLSFLLWPLRPAPDYAAPNFRFHARQLLSSLDSLDVDRLLTPAEDIFVLQIWLATFVFLIWVLHGMPPLGSAVRWVADWDRDFDRG